MRKSRVTAQDVARAASVSSATVSLVVNGKAEGRVPPETRQRVLQEAAALGYTVDRRARGLATGKSGLIGFLVPGMRNPFFSAVHMALLREFGSRYQVLTVTTDMGDEARQNIEQLLALGVDAIIALSVDSDFLSPLKSSVPMVLVDTDKPGPGIAAINFTDERAARELSAHLVGLGHRKALFIEAVRARSRGFAARRRAIFETFAESGGEVIAVEADVDIDRVAGMVEAELDRWRSAGVTAIICATDLQAYGALVGLRNRGVDVPSEMSVAAFDDLPLSKVVTPQLTSVLVPPVDLARVAAAELRNMLAGGAAPDRSIVIGLDLHCRDSTGPAPLREGAAARA